MDNAQLNVDWDEKKRRLVDLLEPLAVAYMYMIAILSPVMGLVFGIIALKKCDLEKNQRLGKICVIISTVALGFWLLCIVAYVMVVVFAATAKGGASPF